MLQRGRDGGRRREDRVLQFIAEVLPGGFLHYGYFDDVDRQPEEVSLNDIARAQRRYAELVADQIENGSGPVLDVGSGMGGMIGVLQKRGLSPVALTPDRTQIEHIRSTYPDVPAIHAKLDLTGSLRKEAALALGQIGPAAKKAVPALRRALRHRHSDLRVAAAEALWRLEQDRSVVPILVAAVRHRDSRDDAIEVLGRIGPAAEEAVPDLIYALKDDSFYIRTLAARALGQVGPKARAAIPALKDTLYADDPDERRAAADALKQIDLDATKGPSDR